LKDTYPSSGSDTLLLSYHCIDLSNKIVVST
jgi:hypothetical protein